MFKIKHKLNNTIRYKTSQVPGVDCTKSFSPVASSSTIAILLLTTLHIEDQGWTCEMFDRRRRMRKLTKNMFELGTSDNCLLSSQL